MFSPIINILMEDDLLILMAYVMIKIPIMIILITFLDLGQPCTTATPCTNTVDHVCEIQTGQTTGLCVGKSCKLSEPNRVTFAVIRNIFIT